MESWWSSARPSGSSPLPGRSGPKPILRGDSDEPGSAPAFSRGAEPGQGPAAHHERRGGGGAPAGGGGAAGAEQREGEARHRRRPDHRRDGSRGRGSVHRPPRPPAADGAGPPDAGGGDQDLQRPGTGGGPRGEPRPVGGPARHHPPDRAGAGDRGAGAGDALGRARGVRARRRRAGARGLPPRRQGGCAQPLGLPDPPHPHDGGPAHHRRGTRALPGEPQPRARGRPRHQYRRGRGLPGGGQVDQASRRGPAGPLLMRRSYLSSLAARVPEPGERLGAIDVGSNSIRLLVAEYDPQGGIKVVDEVKDQPRLAAGIAESKRLDEFAMARAIQALGRMHEVAERRGVRRLTAVATSAVREAENGKEFVERVRREVGIPLRIIEAETEAALSWRSVAHHFPLATGRPLVADIGGGSLELIGAINGLGELTRSPPLGAVRLTEKYLPGERPRTREIAELRARVHRRLKKVGRWREWSNATVIGSGGTFTNLGRMVLARRGHPTEAADAAGGKNAAAEKTREWGRR